MTLTAPGCGMGDILVDDVRTKLELIPTVAEADVELVFDPPWNRSMMSDAARLETGMFCNAAGIARHRAGACDNVPSVTRGYAFSNWFRNRLHIGTVTNVT